MIKDRPNFKLGLGLTLFCLFCLIYLIPAQVGRLTEEAALHPVIITLLILLLSLMLLFKSIRLPASEAREDHGAERIKPSTMVLVIAIMVAYAWLLEWTGFLITSSAAMIALFLTFGVKSPVRIIILTAATILLLYVSFEKFLGAPLPQGLWIESLLG